MVAYDNGWWEFRRGVPDSMISQGDYGDDFDPAGSFTTMMLVEALNEAQTTQHGLIGKSSRGLGSPGGWDVWYNGASQGPWPGSVSFSHGKNGVYYIDLRLDGSPGPMAVGRKVLIACMYTYIGDGNSVMRIVTHDVVNGKLFVQATNAYGPTDNNSLNLYMGGSSRQSVSVCKIYWQGFYDGVVFSDADILAIWNEDKHPVIDFSPTILNYFCQDVESTYVADVGNGPNAPYTFDISGTPVKGGSCLVNDTMILGHQFGVQLPELAILGHTFTTQKRLQRYRRLTAKDRSILRKGL